MHNSNVNSPAPLQGKNLIIAALLLSAANFIVVLDTTIANVSVSHIAGSLAVSPSEGTYVITSYAVAEAITVPLTGWLASRFGTLRTFTMCMMLFGIFSTICGLANNLTTIVLGRILQGITGGPLIPLSQTLLMQIFPQEKRGAALGLWSMTTLIAPILGPIGGGYICDNLGWEFIFYINIPIAIICSTSATRILKRFETPIIKKQIDFIGLILLIIWVGALQFILDEGKKYDWFDSTIICILTVIALIGFSCFIIWEIKHDHPIVNIKVFRHRGYTASVVTISLAFGAFFSSIVLTPLWLQIYMGYTATWSGYTTAAIGILAVFAAPIAAQFSMKYDPRLLVFFGVSWLGLITFIRSFHNTEMNYLHIALPMLFQGIGMPFFFVPLTGLALASVDKEEAASAAGLMSFLRTLAGAVSTSIVITSWENQANIFKTDLVNKINLTGTLPSFLLEAGDINLYILDYIVQSQAVMLATNHIFFIVSLTFIFAACTIWIAPKPKQKSQNHIGH